jgi:GNAT superfamily N-acetyltransferase
VNPPLEPALAHHDAQQAAKLREELIEVHLDARAELLDNPFYSGQRFGERLDSYLLSPGFDLVTAKVGEELIGYAFGGTLPANTLWWRGAEVADPDVTRETGQRTFAFREILVRQAHQRRGHAHRLHDELLGARSEERATLLVRDDNPARELYLRWGWNLVGHLQPFPDSPRFEAMVIPLPLVLPLT